MTTEKKSGFTVITNNELTEKAKNELQTNPIEGSYTNPFYEKLLQFRTEQKRKRFTVEDLLR